MNIASSPVPSYRKPPIIEAVWSAQFSEMAWLLPSHAGLFWSLIREKFPLCQEQPPIAHVVESDKLVAPQPSLIRWFDGPPPTRQWFLSASENELIQLQRDRLCCNWKRVGATDIYPRYAHMGSLFEFAWNTLLRFVTDLQKPMPEVDQCEMTYINHIDIGHGWDSIQQIGNVFPTINWNKTTAFLPPPKTLGARLTFDLPHLNGRLHVALRHVVKADQTSADAQVLLLELTARGLPPRRDLPGLLQWFAAAREAIVRGFTALTTPAMHELWEREQ